MQKTVVNFLENRYYLNGKITELDFYQANKMFEQQINDAWKAGDGVFDEVADKLSKKYYNETYNK